MKINISYKTKVTIEYTNTLMSLYPGMWNMQWLFKKNAGFSTITKNQNYRGK